jgi:hypothetical protein
MLLIVETGSGLLDANSYIDKVDIEKYLPSNVLAKFNELSGNEQDDHLIIASLFIDYSFNWAGRQKTLEQGLSWPRTGVQFQKHEIPNNYIPLQIKRACALAVNLVLEFGIDVFNANDVGEPQIKKDKLGPIEVEYFKALNVNFNGTSQYTDINNTLRGFFKNSDNITSVEVLRT